jgi:hypothetical protein
MYQRDVFFERTGDERKSSPMVAEVPSRTKYFRGMNPLVHVLRGAVPEKSDVATPLTLVAAPAPADTVVDEIDLGKIGFTVDVAMRLVAERLADQDFGSPVAYLQRETPPDLADSA